MDTNDLQDKASRLLRALEDGDELRARDLLHGDDALELAIALARRGACTGLPIAAAVSLTRLLAILAAERHARETLARAVGNPSGIVRDQLNGSYFPRKCDCARQQEVVPSAVGPPHHELIPYVTQLQIGPT